VNPFMLRHVLLPRLPALICRLEELCRLEIHDEQATMVESTMYSEILDILVETTDDEKSALGKVHAQVHATLPIDEEEGSCVFLDPTMKRFIAVQHDVETIKQLSASDVKHLQLDHESAQRAKKTLIAQRLLGDDDMLLRLFAERLVGDSDLYKRLVALSMKSRHVHDDHHIDQAVQFIASNVLSILNFGETQRILTYSLRDIGDWSYTRAPKVNFENAALLYSKFDHSNLNHANFAGSVIFESSFQDAQLHGSIGWSGSVYRCSSKARSMACSGKWILRELDSEIELVDVRASEVVSRYPTMVAVDRNSCQLEAMGISPDGTYFALSYASGSIQVCQVWSLKSLAKTLECDCIRATVPDARY